MATYSKWPVYRLGNPNWCCLNTNQIRNTDKVLNWMPSYVVSQWTATVNVHQYNTCYLSYIPCCIYSIYDQDSLWIIIVNIIEDKSWEHLCKTVGLGSLRSFMVGLVVEGSGLTFLNFILLWVKVSVKLKIIHDRTTASLCSTLRPTAFYPPRLLKSCGGIPTLLLTLLLWDLHTPTHGSI